MKHTYIIILHALYVLEIIETIKSQINYITQPIKNCTFIVHNFNFINSQHDNPTWMNFLI